MEKWQFLIQKQGDRSWHALESPNTEIMEGRYRVLALSQLPNTDIEVRVTHFSPQEVPPKRRIQKRVRRTNSEGLMAVIPFTYLKPGVWELRCAGDLMSDMLGQSWQYGVYLQVLSQENCEPIVEPEPVTPIYTPSRSDSSMGNGVQELAVASQNPLLATGFDQEALIDEPMSPVWVKGESAEQILQNLIDLALPTTDPLAEEVTVKPVLPPQPPCPLVLTLDQETYITRWGHVLTIHGRVDLKADSQTEVLNPEQFSHWELRIELRSPESLAVLTQIRQSLGQQSLPFTVRSTIDIPAECESQLILADIGVYGSVTSAGEVRLLASQSFTITADVTQLLAVTTTPPSHETSTPAAESTPEPSVSLDLELFNLVKTPPVLPNQPTPAPNIPIPESLSSTVIKKPVDSRGLQLPKLPENQTEAIADPESVVVSPLDSLISEDDSSTAALMPAPINLDQLVIKNRRSRILSSSFPYLKRRETVDPDMATVSDLSISSEITDALDIAISNDITELSAPVISSENTAVSEDTAATEIPISEDLPESDLPILEITDEETPSTDEILESPTALASTEIVTLTESEPEQPQEDSTFGDDAVRTVPNMPISHSSPLIRKWMQSQGYSLPEILAPLPQPDVSEQPIPESRSPEPDDIEPQILVEPLPVPTVDEQLATEEISVDVVPEMTEMEMTEAVAIQEQEELEPEPELVDLPTVTELPPVVETAPPLSWLDQEIVVDDIVSTEDVKPVAAGEQRATPSLSIFTSLSEELIEPLPIPQLHVPEGELIAGNSVRVRVELPKVAPQVVVKLWVEDCQTRWLLDGPHLLTELLPNSSGSLEVMIPLNIPFGCLEIRIEAIALNRATQQESHKATVFRTVIPPDLPNLALDELLGL